MTATDYSCWFGYVTSIVQYLGQVYPQCPHHQLFDNHHCHHHPVPGTQSYSPSYHIQGDDDIFAIVIMIFFRASSFSASNLPLLLPPSLFLVIIIILHYFDEDEDIVVKPCLILFM